MVAVYLPPPKELRERDELELPNRDELELPPKPLLTTLVVAGFLFWKLRWLLVGLFSGALILVAVLLKFGDLIGVLTTGLELRLMRL